MYAKRWNRWNMINKIYTVSQTLFGKAYFVHTPSDADMHLTDYQPIESLRQARKIGAEDDFVCISARCCSVGQKIMTMFLSLSGQTKERNQWSLSA